MTDIDLSKLPSPALETLKRLLAERDRLKVELAKVSKSRDWYLLANVEARKALKQIEQISHADRRLAINLAAIGRIARIIITQT